MGYHAFLVALTSILGGFIVSFQYARYYICGCLSWSCGINQSTHQIKHFNCKFDSFNILAGLTLGGFILGGSNVLRLPISTTVQG